MLTNDKTHQDLKEGLPCTPVGGGHAHWHPASASSNMGSSCIWKIHHTPKVLFRASESTKERARVRSEPYQWSKGHAHLRIASIIDIFFYAENLLTRFMNENIAYTRCSLSLVPPTENCTPVAQLSQLSYECLEACAAKFVVSWSSSIRFIKDQMKSVESFEGDNILLFGYLNLER